MASLLRVAMPGAPIVASFYTDPPDELRDRIYLSCYGDRPKRSGAWNAPRVLLGSRRGKRRVAFGRRKNSLNMSFVRLPWRPLLSLPSESLRMMSSEA